MLQVVLSSSVAIEEILDLGDQLRAQKIRVKEVVKDADEEDAEVDEQWHIERVCKVIDRVRGLWKEHQKVGEKLDAKRLGGQQEEVHDPNSRIPRGDPGRPPGDAIQEEADRQDRPQAQGIRRAPRSGKSRNHRLRAEVGSVLEGAPQDAPRDPLVALATEGRRQETRPPPRRPGGDVSSHRRREEEEKERRGRGQAGRTRPAGNRARDPGRRAHGRRRPR